MHRSILSPSLLRKTFPKIICWLGFVHCLVRKPIQQTMVLDMLLQAVSVLQQQQHPYAQQLRIIWALLWVTQLCHSTLTTAGHLRSWKLMVLSNSRMQPVMIYMVIAAGHARPLYTTEAGRGANRPFLAPASTTMLQMVMRSSMLMAAMASPLNSMAL